MTEDHRGARNPVGVLGVDEMADDVERGPCALALVRECPKFGQVTKESVECRRSSGEKSNGLFELCHESWVKSFGDAETRATTLRLRHPG